VARRATLSSDSVRLLAERRSALIGEPVPADRR